MVTFDKHWQTVQANFKALPIKERNFRKRIGIAPDKELQRKVFEQKKLIPAQQLELTLNTLTQ